jgi:hypothetical protein
MAYESPSAASRWLTENWSLVASDFQHQWIAVTETGVVAFDDDLRALLVGIDVLEDRVVLAFVDGQEREDLRLL